MKYIHLPPTSGVCLDDEQVDWLNVVPSYVQLLFIYSELVWRIEDHNREIKNIQADSGKLYPKYAFKLAISTIAKQASKALFSLFRTASLLSFPDPLLLCYLN